MSRPWLIERSDPSLPRTPIPPLPPRHWCCPAWAASTRQSRQEALLTNADPRKETGALFAIGRECLGMELKATALHVTTAATPVTIVATRVVESRVPSLGRRSFASRRIQQTPFLLVQMDPVFSERLQDISRQISLISQPGAPSDVQPAFMDTNPIIDPRCPRSVGGITSVAALCTALDTPLHFRPLDCEPFLHGYGKNCSDAQPTIGVWDLPLIDLSGTHVQIPLYVTK